MAKSTNQSQEYDDKPKITAEGILRPITHGWVKQINKAVEAKAPFDKVAKMCHDFYEGDYGFMFDEKWQSEYLGGTFSPKFKIQIAAAFEMVSIYGPALYWQYANRIVTGYDPIELTPELYGNPNDPAVQQFFMQQQAERAQRTQQVTTRNAMVERMLNWSQREQPYGGLASENKSAVTEAIVKGRSCLWPTIYEFPNATRKLTATFYDTVDNLLIDPDATRGDLRDAYWIARKHVWPTWRVERTFKRKPGSIKAHLESAGAQAVQSQDWMQPHRHAGGTFDETIWYEIWSKGGIGNRLRTLVRTGAEDVFDDTVGDYAYLCIVPGMDHPLNVPPSLLDEPGSGDGKKIKKAVEWRCAEYGPPCSMLWMDDRWPVVLVDFYDRLRSPWPLAPLAMSLGELILLNTLASMFAERADFDTKNVIAVLKSGVANVQEAFSKNQNPVILEINEGLGKSVDEMVRFVDKAPMPMESYRVFEMTHEMFKRSSGLADQMYGSNAGGVDRSAADTLAKRDSVQVRPDYMARCVDDAQSEVAQIEAILACAQLEGKDVALVLGPEFERVWDWLVVDEDPEVLLREVRARVEANSSRKPNRGKMTKDLSDSLGWILPILRDYAAATGDTEPINKLFERFGYATENESGFVPLRRWRETAEQPQTPEEQATFEQQQQLAQEMGQLQLELLQAQVKNVLMDLEKKKVDIAHVTVKTHAEAQEAMHGTDAASAHAEQQAAQQQLQLDFDRAQQQLQQADERHQQEMGHVVQRSQQELAVQQEEDAAKMEAIRKRLFFDQETDKFRFEQEKKRIKQQAEIQRKKQKMQNAGQKDS